MTGAWQFWIDRGGTFTDVIGLAPGGALHVRKELTAGEQDAGIRGIRALLGEGAEARIDPVRIDSVRVGTTVATNALLERRGEPVLLVTTAGFRDQLRIGYQNRPELFARHIVPAELLHADVVEADERIGADGTIFRPLDEAALMRELRAARARGLRSAAIVFLHGWRFTAHEVRAADLARSCGFEQVSVSHRVTPLARYVVRGDTTVLDAYLAGVVDRYVEGLRREVAAIDSAARLEFMQSSGGLVAAEGFRATASVLSGPAGGLIGMARLGERLGLPRLVGFDMGGTSTDVSLVDGELPRRYEHLIAGLRLQAAMLDVHTIAAGGGSIVEVRDGRLTVGPQSAGAAPGPASYGRGGPLAVTDLHVLLGRLQPEFLPHVFGAAADAALDREAARRAATAVAARAGIAAQDLPMFAESALHIAVEAMGNAIRHVATQRGCDPADFALFAFGGAAGQLACRVAAAAGMRRALVHPLASVLSAYGVGVADLLDVRRTSVRRVLDADGLAAAREALRSLGETARAALVAQGAGRDAIRVQHVLEVRAGESEATLDLSLDDETLGAPSPGALAREFAGRHQRRYGYAPTDATLVVESVRAEARHATQFENARLAPTAPLALPARVMAWFEGWRDVPVIARESLGAAVDGPALIVDRHTTVVVEHGWRACGTDDGAVLLESHGAATEAALADAARLEIFNALFMHVAEEMGAVLRQTAQSVNIKERLDYSCALFDAQGGLVANAPHMPVHLGSMGTSVRAVITAHAGTLRAGDAYLLNSPYHGGTHLPDVTVVTPVFLQANAATPDFYVASRAHHADIGGVTPGSMPPFSRTIDEEGALIADLHVVRAGLLDDVALRTALGHPPAGERHGAHASEAHGTFHPARNVAQNLADVRAQLAANARGIAELERAAARFGVATLHDFMRRVQHNAADCVRAAIDRLAGGTFAVEMDGGQTIAVRIDIDRAARRARIDFTGTSPQGEHNFHAPRAVTLAAVLYVFRTLVPHAIPLNEGCLEPLDIVIPPGSMLDPRPPAAVVAGNVETSQCIVDALYGALGELAASQGTMNNFTFGDARLQYYETIAGGSGAGPGFPGADAVQTHMTNSRLTDPEVLEDRFPVLLREFSIRRGSGGAGRFRGGDGVVRIVEFLAPLEVAMLANRRRTQPFGLAGGAPGAPGRTVLVHRDGARVECDACMSASVAPGDRIEVHTPGGGGYGATAATPGTDSP